MPKFKMSHEELKVQHDKIVAVDTNTSETVVLVRKMWKYMPYVSGICMIIGGIGGFAIGAYKYDESIVKKPQFSRHEMRENKIDSMLNAKIDTVNKNKINYTDIKTSLAKTPHRQNTVRWFIEHKNPDGSITPIPID